MVSLKKGQKVSLKKKNGSQLNKIFFGLNWGMITKKNFLFGESKISVDFDISIVLLDKQNNILETIYFRNKTAPGIKHHGDDQSGDEKDDGLDNEVIELLLSDINPKTVNIGLLLNSYLHQKLDSVPYAGCRVFEGSVDKPTNILAKVDIANSVQFKGKESIIMGALRKEGDSWEFVCVAKPTNATTITQLGRDYVNFVKGN